VSKKLKKGPEICQILVSKKKFIPKAHNFFFKKICYEISEHAPQWIFLILIKNAESESIVRSITQ
jgi:hypothetical protein